MSVKGRRFIKHILSPSETFYPFLFDSTYILEKNEMFLEHFTHIECDRTDEKHRYRIDFGLFHTSDIFGSLSARQEE